MYSVFPVFEEYRKLSGFEIEESVQRETSGSLKELLLAVGKCWSAPSHSYAVRPSDPL